MSSTLDLSSVWAKLRRAEEHAHTFENEARSWIQSDPYRLTLEPNADFTRFSVVIHINNKPSFERWALIVSDAIHNFRCALDHLLYSVAILQTESDPPPGGNRIFFPICDTPAIFNKTVANIQSNTPDIMEGSVLDTVQRFQPYNRPHPRLPPLLSLLRELDNSDKHRLLNMVMGAPWYGHGDINISNRQCRLLVSRAEVVDNQEIAAFYFDRPTPNANPKFETNIVLAIRNPTKVGQNRLEIADVLPEMVVEVRSVLESIKSGV